MNLTFPLENLEKTHVIHATSINRVYLAQVYNVGERTAVGQQHEEHLKRANSRYLKHDYDFFILAKAQSTCNWVIPPEWNDREKR